MNREEMAGLTQHTRLHGMPMQYPALVVYHIETQGFLEEPPDQLSA
jgi:hypothetical protein